MKSKKMAIYGLLVALAFILSYIESLFPVPVPIPGIKLGLANLVVLTALYSMGVKEAFVLSVIRIFSSALPLEILPRCCSVWREVFSAGF
jgi:Predicted membrane protein